MGLSATVLGCSGTYAAPDNACSGYLVDGDGFRVLVDCGPGTLANLQHHLRPDGLDAVLISHSHPDHWLELPVLRNALKYLLGRSGLPVFGTVETLELAEPLCGGRLSPPFEWRTISDSDELKLGPMEVRFARTAHPPETLSMRFDLGDAGLAYSADTGPGWSFAELGRGIDLGICEATFLDRDRLAGGGTHMSAAQAGEGARRSGVDRLVITHLVPGSDPAEHRAEAADAYGAPVEVASVGARFDV